MASSRSTSESRLQLSAEEMRDISLEISRGFAPRRFRAGGRAATSGFSPQELFNISQQISREFAPRADARAPGAPSLVLLPVDPRRLHAYWQLPEPPLVPADEPTESPAAAEPALTLRIYRQAEAADSGKDQAETRPAWFDLPVSGQSSQQRIALPEQLATAAGYYQAAIGHLDQYKEFTALAYSNPAAVAEVADAAGEWLPPAIAQFVMPAGAGSLPSLAGSSASSAVLACSEHE